MKEQTLGMVIASLRKEKKMTQLDLANQLGVTDKAVSKWERDLSCPDVQTIPKLAGILGVSVDELLQSRIKPDQEKKETVEQILDTVLKAVPFAMGIALIVISVLKKDLDIQAIGGLCGVGLFALSLQQLRKK